MAIWKIIDGKPVRFDEESGLSNIDDVTVDFSEADTRENVSKTDTMKIILGKVMKWFSDLSGGAASTLLGQNLTEEKVLVSDTDGKVAVSNVTSEELGYLSGTESSVQTQLDGKVNKNGDTMTGELVLKKGSIVNHQQGTQGQAGYVNIIKIKIKDIWSNYPLIFEVTGRGWNCSRVIYIMFHPDANTDPNLRSFLIDNLAQYEVAIAKTEESTWNIYMKKNEPYGVCVICRVHNTYDHERLEITYPNISVSELPEGYIEPSVIPATDLPVSYTLPETLPETIPDNGSTLGDLIGYSLKSIQSINSTLADMGSGSTGSIISLVQKTGNFNLIADNHQSLETYTVPENGFYYVGFNINGYVNVDCRIYSSIIAAGFTVGSDDKTLTGYFAGTMSAIVKLNQGDQIIARLYSSVTYSGSTRGYFFNVIKL